MIGIPGYCCVIPCWSSPSTLDLYWSDWALWDNLKVDARSDQGVLVPNGIPGAYEVRLAGADERLTIG